MGKSLKQRITQSALLSFLSISPFVTTGCHLMARTFASSDPVSIVYGGDVMVHEPELRSAYKKSCKCYDYKPVFAAVKPYVESADLAIANLETTLPGDSSRYSGYPQFGSPDAVAEALKDAGFDILTTANNHCVDKGKSGLVRTLDVLDRLALVRLGTFKSDEDYTKHRITTVEKKGYRIVMLDYTYGTNEIKVPDGVFVNHIDKDLIKQDIERARQEKADAIFVLYHFGTEYLRFPDEFQKEMVDFALNEGADAVLGGHPHVIQPFERKTVTDRWGIQKERLVVYSPGNFVSHQVRRYTDGGILLRFQMERNEDGEGVRFSSINYEPVWVLVDHNGEGGKLRHRLIPVREFSNPEHAPYKLSEKARKEMELFHSDTTTHLAKSMEMVQDRDDR